MEGNNDNNTYNIKDRAGVCFDFDQFCNGINLFGLLYITTFVPQLELKKG
jgi:hypothetical protein